MRLSLLASKSLFGNLTTHRCVSLGGYSWGFVELAHYFNNNKRWGDKVTVQGKACSLISNHLSLYNSAWI